MQLVIVEHRQFATFELLTRTFADDPDLRVLWDRRTRERRGPNRPAISAERRRRLDRRRDASRVWIHPHYVVVRSKAVEGQGGKDRAKGQFESPTRVPTVFQDLRRDIECAARSDLSVLISGGDDPSRTSLAYWIHERSDRRDCPFVLLDRFGAPVRSSHSEPGRLQLPSSRNAPRGALWLESAHNRTLCIEEVGDLSWELQTELLQQCERWAAGQVARAGDRSRPGRIIAATGYDLLERIASGDFRTDLLYRLNTVHVAIPANVTV